MFNLLLEVLVAFLQGRDARFKLFLSPAVYLCVLALDFETGAAGAGLCAVTLDELAREDMYRDKGEIPASATSDIYRMPASTLFASRSPSLLVSSGQEARLPVLVAAYLS
jgi:hypothetical protein